MPGCWLRQVGKSSPPLERDTCTRERPSESVVMDRMQRMKRRRLGTDFVLTMTVAPLCTCCCVNVARMADCHDLFMTSTYVEGDVSMLGFVVNPIPGLLERSGVLLRSVAHIIMFTNSSAWRIGLISSPSSMTSNVTMAFQWARNSNNTRWVQTQMRSRSPDPCCDVDGRRNRMSLNGDGLLQSAPRM